MEFAQAHAVALVGGGFGGGGGELEDGGAFLGGSAHVFGDFEGAGAGGGLGGFEADGAALGDFVGEAAGEGGYGMAEDEEGGGAGFVEEAEEGVEAFFEAVGRGGEPGNDGVEDDEGVVAVGKPGAEFVEGFGEGKEGKVAVVGDDGELFGGDGLGDIGAEAVGFEGDVVGGFFGEEEEFFADLEDVAEEAEGEGAGAAPAAPGEEGGSVEVQALEEVVEGDDAGFDFLEGHGADSAGAGLQEGRRGLRRGSGVLRVRGCGFPGRRFPGLRC